MCTAVVQIIFLSTSKEAAALYKETLDGLNGRESRVVISESHNDPEHIKQWTPSDSEKSQ